MVKTLALFITVLVAASATALPLHGRDKAGFDISNLAKRQTGIPPGFGAAGQQAAHDAQVASGQEAAIDAELAKVTAEEDADGPSFGFGRREIGVSPRQKGVCSEFKC
ncbi:hypothetical protein FB451DRAFT_1171722 [Mycena latifolia]|nr:hypothetical protein FB451DRAFT_1171722 [Mycena latifolia]